MNELGESKRANQNAQAIKSTKNVHMKENHVVIKCAEVESDGDDFEEIHRSDLAEAQELTARNVNPVKLIMLLRTRFGIGRYEIQVKLPS